MELNWTKMLSEPEQGGHVFRQPGLEFHQFTCHGMYEGQPEGVKGLSCNTTVIRVIEKIAGKRMAYRL